MSVMPAVKIDEEDATATPKSTSKRKGKSQVIDIAKARSAKQKAAKSAHLSDERRQELVLEFRTKARKLGRSILRKWHARMDLQEVDSIVDLSLCEAVKRFDPTRGASFMTFLYYHLKGNLIRAVSSAANANVIPTGDPESLGRGGDGREGGVNAIDVAEALCSHEHLLPDEVVLKKELVSLSHEACSRLDPLEREVIERVYLKGQQLMDIAHSLGYSRCHISRVKKKALETLQQDMSYSLEIQAEAVKQTAHELKLIKSKERKKVHRRRPRSKKAQEASNLKAVVNG